MNVPQAFVWQRCKAFQRCYTSNHHLLRNENENLEETWEFRILDTRNIHLSQCRSSHCAEDDDFEVYIAGKPCIVATQMLEVRSYICIQDNYLLITIRCSL